MTCLGLVATLLIIFILWGPGGIYISHQEEQKVVVIEKGVSSAQVAQTLLQERLISHEYIFYVALMLENKKGKLKAGEYLIPAKTTPQDIVRLLSSGKVIVHQVTFPEGITVQEVIDKIQDISHLKGPVLTVPEEGSLMPETYTYVYGETKQGMIQRLKENMTKFLEETWQNRSPCLPYASPSEALTMASIVEKETGVTSERSRVAAVFVNRLRNKMRLQADPTVIYGITLGRSKMTRNLTRDDLQTPTIYNTYMIDALPPHPIACPGKASILAALNPAPTRDLYFVADGRGGHNFSETLAQHNGFVRQWRKKR